MGLLKWLFSWLFAKRNSSKKKPKKRRPYHPRKVVERPRRTVSTSPKSERVTKELKCSYKFIESAKRAIESRQRLSNSAQERLQWLGRQVVDCGVKTTELCAKEIFAAIFLVNHLWKWCGARQAVETKNYLQRVLVTYHADTGECQVRQIHDGEYAGCWEMKCDIWCTHIPDYVIQNLERPGKPSAVEALWRNHRRG